MFGNGLGAAQKAIEHLGYVQTYTLSVVAYFFNLIKNNNLLKVSAAEPIE